MVEIKINLRYTSIVVVLQFNMIGLWEEKNVQLKHKKKEAVLV